MYLLQTFWWLRLMFPKHFLWEMPLSEAPCVYLTFDDGPHEVATPFAIRMLEKYEAKATFFCIGKNVEEQPALYQQILESGHAVGNHTYQHLNGWKTDSEVYVADVERASQSIQSLLFRPPYGRITRSQAEALQLKGFTIVMWSLLSADFDTDISPQQCADIVLKHLKPGSIVVFHDSEKAFERMRYALPAVLEHCKNQGWEMKTLQAYSPK